MFISFEGIDFCGKTTQVKILTKYLEDRDEKILLIREPGGTVISEKIREILLDKKHLSMSTETEILLFSASRAQLVKEIIAPAINRGEYVITDRFFDSTTAYQGFGRGISLESVKLINRFAVGNSIPDITFFIDISLEEVAKRKASQKGRELDRIELSNDDFFNRVRGGYLELCRSEERFKYIDGKKSVESIHHEIITIINETKNMIKN